MLTLFLINVLFGCNMGSCFSIVSPNNTAALSGDRLSLECRAEGNESFVREWTVKPTSDNLATNPEPQLIFSHWKNQAVYTISPDFSHFEAQVDTFGSGVLYTDSSRMDDAGSYTCVVEANKTIYRYSAQVVIVQTPHCEASFEADDLPTVGDRIWMRCMVTCRGNFAPIIHWRKHQSNGDLEPDGKMVTEGIQDNNVAGCNISSTLTTILAQDNFCFSYKLFFPSYNSSSEPRIAKNAPKFSYTWKSPEIKSKSQTTDEIFVYAPVSNKFSAETQAPATTNWLVISVALGAAMLIVIVLMGIITTVLCCRMKKRTIHVDERTAVEVSAGNSKEHDIQTSTITVTSLAPLTETSVPYEPEGDDVIQDDCYEKIGDVGEEDGALNMAFLGNRCPDYVVRDDCYQRISDVSEEDGASNTVFLDNQCPGYLSLLPPYKCESSAYFPIYDQSIPADELHLTDSVELGQVESALHLTNQKSDLERLTSPGNASAYLALVVDTRDASTDENQSSDYLKPCDDVQKERCLTQQIPTG